MSTSDAAIDAPPSDATGERAAVAALEARVAALEAELVVARAPTAARLDDPGAVSQAHLENSPLAVVEFDTEFHVIRWSAEATRLFGWTREEVLGRELDRIPWVHPGDLDAVAREAAGLVSGERTRSLHRNRNLRKDGSILHCEWYSSAVHDASGRLVSVLSQVLDVTERERAAHALQQSEERLRLALGAGGMAAWDWNVATGEVLWNDEHSRMLGYVLGGVTPSLDAWSARLHPDDRDATIAVLERSVAQGADYVAAFRVVRAGDGAVRWIEARGRVAQDDRGRATRCYGVMQDITEQRRAEDALRDADRRKNEFLAVLSHELRNPLAPIRNSLRVLERAEPGGEKARRAHGAIERQVRHLTRLVGDLLDVTRISRGKITLQLADVDLAALVRDVGLDLEWTFEAAGVALVVEGVERPVVVHADAARLTQVFDNLLQNAVKFTSAGGTTRVALEVDVAAREAVLCVRDTGVGMREDTLARLFVPFMQAETTLERSRGGLGLGLARARGIGELHGGTIRAARDGPGQGSELVVRLPLAG